MATAQPPRRVVYPDSDGQPMSDNMKQWEVMVYLKQGLDRLFADRPDVFVASDLLWYPVEGHPEIRQAPDVMVAFGRPKGLRGSYKQWEEGGHPLNVVFEILSPGNRYGELVRKHQFYERYGVQEYYVHDPDRVTFEAFRHTDGQLAEVTGEAVWTSPLLGVRFNLIGGELHVVGPDGQPFVPYLDLADQVGEERRRAEQERQRAEQERQRADTLAAEVERLRERLRALGQPTNGGPAPS